MEGQSRDKGAQGEMVSAVRNERPERDTEKTVINGRAQREMLGHEEQRGAYLERECKVATD